MPNDRRLDRQSGVWPGSGSVPSGASVVGVATTGTHRTTDVTIRRVLTCQDGSHQVDTEHGRSLHRRAHAWILGARCYSPSNAESVAWTSGVSSAREAIPSFVNTLCRW